MLHLIFEKDSSESSVADTGKDLPDGDYSDMGAGTMYLNTAGGTSENGNVPVLFESSDIVTDQMDVNTSDFDNTKLSYIYIDGMLNTKSSWVTLSAALPLKKMLWQKAHIKSKLSSTTPTSLMARW